MGLYADQVLPRLVNLVCGASSSAPYRERVCAGLDGQVLPFADQSFDSALTTWTLCTIPDVSAALGELRRVLRPGGSLHFVEHGLAPDAQVQRWQRSAGFDVVGSEEFYEPKAPRFLAADTLGVAVSP